MTQQEFNNMEFEAAKKIIPAVARGATTEDIVRILTDFKFEAYAFGEEAATDRAIDALADLIRRK